MLRPCGSDPVLPYCFQLLAAVLFVSLFVLAVEEKKNQCESHAALPTGHSEGIRAAYVLTPVMNVRAQRRPPVLGTAGHKETVEAF